MRNPFAEEYCLQIFLNRQIRSAQIAIDRQSCIKGRKISLTINLCVIWRVRQMLWVEFESMNFSTQGFEFFYWKLFYQKSLFGCIKNILINRNRLFVCLKKVLKAFVRINCYRIWPSIFFVHYFTDFGVNKIILIPPICLCSWRYNTMATSMQL